MARINPSLITGSVVATGDSNAAGPYLFRGCRSTRAVRVSAVSTNSTDVCNIFFMEPGVVPAANKDEKPEIANYVPAQTCPFSIVLDGQEMGGNVDIWVGATTCTGTIAIKIEKVL